MKSRWCVLVAAVACLSRSGVSALENGGEIALWPGAAPGSEHLTIKDKITERSSDLARPDRIHTQIVHPTLRVHRPPNPNGAAVIIAPGGAYQRVVIDKEGPDTSVWLNSLGVTVFVLKYRLPGEGHEHAEDVALQDAQRAMRVVRAHAAEWGIDPNKIGFLGFSAGGHVAATLAFFHDNKIYALVDTADALSARPDFVVLGYAGGAPEGAAPENLEVLEPQPRMMWKYRIVPDPEAPCPPAFLFHAADDASVSPEHATKHFFAIRKSGASAELHIFKTGGHGFGIRDARGPSSLWPVLCETWLRGLGVVP